MATLSGRLAADRGIVSCSIRRVTGSCVSHVELRLDPDWGRGQGYVSAFLDTGVSIRPLDYESYPFAIPFSLQVSDDQKRAAIAKALGMVGFPYAKRAILSDLFHIDITEPHEADCSEFVCEVLNAARPVLHIIDPVGLITPRDLLLSPELQFGAFLHA